MKIIGFAQRVKLEKLPKTCYNALVLSRYVVPEETAEWALNPNLPGDALSAGNHDWELSIKMSTETSQRLTVRIWWPSCWSGNESFHAEEMMRLGVSMRLMEAMTLLLSLNISKELYSTGNAIYFVGCRKREEFLSHSRNCVQQSKQIIMLATPQT